MTTVTWKNNSSGNWATASNWSTGLVPGSTSDVSIETSSPQTITYSTGSTSILSLYIGNDTLALTGGSLSVLGNTTIDGGLAQTGGALNLDGLSATISGTFNQSAGTINIASGSLSLGGYGNTLAGVFSGGILNFANGSDVLASGASLNVAGVIIGYATVTLESSRTYGGSWIQTAGTLALGGQTLTETGNVTLEGGDITGAGTLAIMKTGEISGLQLQGSAVLSNSGSLTQTGSWNLGISSTDTAQLVNKLGATFTIADSSTIYSNGNTVINNAGTLVMQAGLHSVINASVTNTGVIAIGSGTLTFAGASDSFGGTISGAGELEIYNGSNTFKSGLSLTVSEVLLDYANLTLTAAQSYGGNWIQTAGTLALGGQTLTETGNVTLEGGDITGAGTLAIMKTGEISGLQLQGSAVLSNSGSLTQTGSWNLGISSTDTAQLVNKLGATFTIADSSTIYSNGNTVINNAGTLVMQAGLHSVINASVTNTGVIAIGSGTLTFAGASDSFGGTISGAGELEIYNGSNTFKSGLSLTVSEVLLDYANLTLTAAQSYGGNWIQTAGTLALGGQTLTETGNVTLEGGDITGAGTLAIMKTGEISGLQLQGSAVLSNSGSLTQTGEWTLGSSSTDTAQLVNKLGATFTIADSSTIYSNGNTVINNAGTLVMQAGLHSVINASVTNTGVVAIGSGTLTFAGASDSFGGTISGAGELEIYNGSNTFKSGLSLTVSEVLLDYANLTLTAAQSYGGNWIQTAGTLALGGQTLTETGNVTLEGGDITGAGTLAIMKTGEISGLQLQGSAVLSNSGSLTQTGEWTLGSSSTDTAQLVNKLGATFTIAGSSTIYSNGNTVINNAGTLVMQAGGTSQIDVAVINSGTVNISSGSLTFLRTISGNGNFNMGAATRLTFDSAVASGGNLTLGSYADLFVNATAGFHETIYGFSNGNIVEMGGFDYTGSTLSFNSANDQLTIQNGMLSSTLQFAGALSLSSFHLFSDNGVAAIAHS